MVLEVDDGFRILIVLVPRSVASSSIESCSP